MSGKVYFVGAGPGDPDLLTVKGLGLVQTADVIIYADSLVHPAVAAKAKPGAEVVGSSSLPLGAIVAKMVDSARAGKLVVRLQSGDPSIYGAMREQMVRLAQEGIPYEVVPGVSSAFAAAARLGVELTLPGVSQTVVFTRYAKRTAETEGRTVVLFLSAALAPDAVRRLQQEGFRPETPAAVAYRVGWEDELLLRGRLIDVPRLLREHHITRQALILVGEALAEEVPPDLRSHLYREDFSHLFRKGAREMGGGPSS